jgi:hypothetical protein
MTRFEIESTELVRFDRRMLADVGLLDGEGPNPSQLRKLQAKSGLLATLLRAVAARIPSWLVSASAAR